MQIHDLHPAVGATHKRKKVGRGLGSGHGKTSGRGHKGNKARERIWETKSGKADFTTPKMLSANGFKDAPGRYRLSAAPAVRRYCRSRVWPRTSPPV